MPGFIAESRPEHSGLRLVAALGTGLKRAASAQALIIGRVRRVLET